MKFLLFSPLGSDFAQHRQTLPSVEENHSDFDVNEIDFRDHDRDRSSQACNLVIVIVNTRHPLEIFVDVIVNSFIVS